VKIASEDFAEFTSSNNVKGMFSILPEVVFCAPSLLGLVYYSNRKGLIDPSAIEEVIQAYETKIGPRNGARVVARAWVDSSFKERLLADASAL